MADKKISELTELASSALNTGNDFLPIVDASESQTKRIAIGNLPFTDTIVTTVGSTLTGTGNIRFGRDQTSTGTTMFIDQANGRVGIRTDSPESTLTVSGGTVVQGGNFKVSDGDFFVSGNNPTTLVGRGSIFTNLGDISLAGTNTSGLHHGHNFDRTQVPFTGENSLQPLYTIGASQYGMLVKDEQYAYITLTGGSLDGISGTPQVLIPNYGASKCIVVKELTALLKVTGGLLSGSGIGAATGIIIGQTVSGISGKTFSSTAQIPKATLDLPRSGEAGLNRARNNLLYERDAPSEAAVYNFGADLVVKSNSDTLSSSSDNLDKLLIKLIIKYKIYDMNNSFGERT
jgi:hypothetical protein